MNFKELEVSKKRVEDSYNSYMASTKKPTCDKHGFGFNIYDRFSGGKQTISIDSWTGYYGNSSCSTAIRVDTVFFDYFTRWLNLNKHKIMEEIILSMKHDLKVLSDSEISSIEQRLKELKAIREDVT